MINNICFTGKSTYLESTKVIADNKTESMKPEDELHIDKAHLLKAVDQFLSPNKQTLSNGFTTVIPEVSKVFTVFAPEFGPDDNKIMISATEPYNDSLVTEIHELSRDDFSSVPEYIKIFNSLRDKI